MYSISSHTVCQDTLGGWGWVASMLQEMHWILKVYAESPDPLAGWSGISLHDWLLWHLIPSNLSPAGVPCNSAISLHVSGETGSFNTKQSCIRNAYSVRRLPVASLFWACLFFHLECHSWRSVQGVSSKNLVRNTLKEVQTFADCSHI